MRSAFRVITLFVLGTFLLHFFGVFAQKVLPTPLGIGRYFPVSYGTPRVPTTQQIAIAIAVVAAFVGAKRFLLRRVPVRYGFVAAAAVGCLAILGTTTTQGITRGFVYPIAGREPRAGGQQYWHDVETQQINTNQNATRFVRNFAVIQPTLKEHARTHPPGAVLLFAFLRYATRSHAGIAAVILCVMSVALTAYGFALLDAPPDAILLYCILPAAQIYGCATLDALIAGLLLIAVAAHSRGGRYTTIAISAFFAASWLTFGVVWAVPVLFVAEWVHTRRFVRTLILLAVTGMVLAALRPAAGFDYLAAFRFASHNENPHGFRLLANPANYLATRIEDVAELAFFAAPFALAAAARGAKVLRTANPAQAIICAAAGATLLALFLSGAFRTGETARACLFVYPFLILPALAGTQSDSDRKVLIVGTFLTGAVLQCIGFYFW